jgi:hypothetical protein
MTALDPDHDPGFAAAKARADRGSPMFTEPEAQSVTRLTYSPCYDYLFPKDRFDLKRVSYYFEHETEETVGDEGYEELFAAVELWQRRWRERPRPFLRYRKAWETIFVEDGRNGRVKEAAYTGPPAALYEFCADARTPKEIAARFDGAPWPEEALGEFLERDLMVQLDGRYLSLALPSNPYV